MDHHNFPGLLFLSGGSSFGIYKSFLQSNTFYFSSHWLSSFNKPLVVYFSLLCWSFLTIDSIDSELCTSTLSWINFFFFFISTEHVATILDEFDDVKRWSGKRIFALLSSSTPFSKSDLWDKGSAGLVFPGQCTKVKWYSHSNCCHHACLLDRSWSFLKYVRFWWSIRDTILVEQI